jgi:hypothetical protein
MFFYLPEIPCGADGIIRMLSFPLSAPSYEVTSDLAIVKDIVKKFATSIHIESQPILRQLYFP